MKKFIQTLFIVIFFQAALIYPQESKWEWLGPEGGEVIKIKAAPSERNIVYCGMKDGSVFRSDNGGKEWMLIGWFPEGISNLDVHRDNSQIIYIGTNTNLYISTTGGYTWQNTGWTSGGMYALTVDPVDPKNIYASSFGSFGGIWKSGDGGISWSFKSFPVNSGMTSDICVDPVSNNIVYECDNNWNVNKSTDYGESWVVISEIKGSPNDLDIDPSNTNTIYLATSAGVFRSTDGGLSWLEKNGGINRDNTGTEEIIINPTNTNHLYRTTNNNWTTNVSYNRGDTWKATKLTAGSITFVSDSLLLSGTRDGIYALNIKSDNSYFSSNRLYGTTIKSVQVSSLSNPFIFAVTEDAGIGKAFLNTFNDELNSWSKYSWGSGISEIITSPFDANVVIGGFNVITKGINFSSNGGQTWQIKPINETVRALEYSHQNPSVIFAGGYSGFFKTSDLGDNWQTILLPNNCHSIQKISVGNNDNLIFVGLDRGYDWSERRTLLSTSNGGETWRDHNFSSNSILIVPGSPNIVLCGTSGTLFRTTDFGSTWFKINIVLDSIDIHSIEYFKNNLIFAGTNKGVFYSKDLGLTWLELEDVDLLHKSVLDICFTENPYPSIIIGTYGGGVYRKNIDYISNTGNEFQIKTFKLSNNYPNPFNSSTIINYSIPKQSEVLINLIDILGREIKVLVNEIKPEGDFNLHIKLDDLPSGIYFVKMVSGNFAETKKIILMK